MSTSILNFKFFTIEQSFNSQNDRIWAESSPGEDVIVTRIQKIILFYPAF